MPKIFSVKYPAAVTISAACRNRLATMAALLLALFIGFSAPASASGAPAHIESEIPNARLAGQHDFRWFGLKIYSAQLWVGDAGYRAAAPTDAKFALDLRYARTLDGARIAESSRDEMQKLGLGTSQQHQSWLAQMSGLFPDVQDGTHLTGVYLPNAGVRFYQNGKRLGDVPDADFGRAFFAIWLDPKTSAPALRAALLENAAPR